MESKIWISCLVMIVCCLSNVASRPSEYESTAITDEVDEPENESDSVVQDGRGVSYYRVTQPPEELPESTRDILEKIKRINEQLSKPRRDQINFNKEEPDEPSYTLDDDALKQLQQLINTGKLQPLSQQATNNNYESNNLRQSFSRALPFGQQNAFYQPQSPGFSPGGIQNQPSYLAPQQNAFQAGNEPPQNPTNFAPPGSNIPQQGVNNSPMAYIMMNLPVLVPVPASEMYQAYNPSMSSMSRLDSPFTMRQRPQIPFPVQWPLAQYFPIFIKDPLLNYLAGGSWGDIIEYGQSADICNRKQKSKDAKEETNESDNEENTNTIASSRQSRAIKKRTVSHTSQAQLVESKKPKQQKLGLNIFGNKNKVTKKKPTQVDDEEEEEAIDTKSRPSDGDLRHPFSEFGLFGHKKPIAPSPGFFINRLKVRRGGVAIAGPGGVATAGRGGTAIVGPGGLAYTQPGGMAVAGPAAKIYALPSTTDLSSLVAQLQNQQTPDDGSVPRKHSPQGKLVATGPIIYYHELEQTWGRGAVRREQAEISRVDRFSDVIAVERSSNGGAPFLVSVKPVANAVSGSGVAIANPISMVVLGNNTFGTVVHTPVASAVVGPGGIAHAQSDLYLYSYTKLSNNSVQYLPFYGGAKGQYLEVTKDTAGNTIKERIVSEESISNENIVKNRDENLLSRVLAGNLQSVNSLSTSLLKLHNLGRKTGSLARNEKRIFREQLGAIGEAATNLGKLVEEIGDDVDVLFKAKTVKKQQNFEDDVGEEGVGIDSEYDQQPESELGEVLSGTTIAEAKPVGLAVVGENGLAASRPVGTAIAASGIAIARPIATAIAGIDPAALGINFQVNHS